MSQIFQSQLNVGTLVKISGTTVQLSPSVIRLGGRQYTTQTLACDVTVSGVGGLDIGSMVANSFYYVYAVLNAGVVSLVCSLSASIPTGFTVYKLVGGFYSDGLSAVLDVVKNDGLVTQEYSFHALASTMTFINGGVALRWGALDNIGFPILSYNDSTGKFTANTSCLASVHANSALTSSSNVFVYWNGLYGFDGTPGTTSSITTPLKMTTGSFFSIGANASLAGVAGLKITAQAQSPIAGLITNN